MATESVRQAARRHRRGIGRRDLRGRPSTASSPAGTAPPSGCSATAPRTSSGSPISLIAPRRPQAEQAEVRARLLAGEPHRADGDRAPPQRRHASSRCSSPHRRRPTTSGAIVGLSVICQDITARRRRSSARSSCARRASPRPSASPTSAASSTTSRTGRDDVVGRVPPDPRRRPGSHADHGAVRVDAPPRRPAAIGGGRGRRPSSAGTPFDLQFRVIRGRRRSSGSCGPAPSPRSTPPARVLTIAGTMTDETERASAELTRQEAETRFEIGFEQAGIGAAIARPRRAPDPRQQRPSAPSSAAPRTSCSGSRWAGYSHPEDLPLGQAVLKRLTAGHDDYTDEHRFVRPDGSVGVGAVHITLVRDESAAPQYYLAQLQDISVRKEMERELAHQAMHDTLTGLPNRALLTDRLLQGLAGSRRRSSQLGVMFIDVDHFKLVNDSFGHDAGDDLLRAAAGQDRGLDPPGRHRRPARRRRVRHRLQRRGPHWRPSGSRTRVVAALAEPWSIGAPRAVRHGQPRHRALGRRRRRRRRLLRDCRRRDVPGEGAWPGPQPSSSTRRSAPRPPAACRSPSAIRHALERDEFMVHYQPVVDLTSGAMISVEALLRWEHPDARAGPPRRVHPDRRGERPDRADRRLGAGAGLSQTSSSGSVIQAEPADGRSDDARTSRWP